MTGVFWQAWAAVVVHLRLLVVAGWLAAAGAAVLYLPGLGSGAALDLAGLVPDESPATETAARSARLFSVPLVADTAVVERDPEGLSAEEQERIARQAAAATARKEGGDEIVFALPVVNRRGLVPGAREDGTTAVTYLFFSASTDLEEGTALARGYAAEAGAGRFAGVTGPGPARLEQYERIESSLPVVEAGTTALVALVVGFATRSVGAPLLVLIASAVAFLVARGGIPWAAGRLDATVPREVEPLVVALTLGVVTDYAVFFLAGCRRRLAEGEPRVAAARRACASVAPIVGTAGLIVVAGSAALMVGTLEFFRAFGPALALTAAVSLVVSATLVPALLAVFGRALFWPGLRVARAPERRRRATPGREALARFLTSPPVAAVAVLACVALLVTAATAAGQTKLAFRLVSGLPSGSESRQAADAAAQGFAPGILAPTLVLVERDGIAAEREGLARLEDELGRLPGVAGVVGPDEQGTAGPENVFLAEGGNAARFAVLFADSPLGSAAIADLNRLRDRLPALLGASGLDRARAGVAGQTALASDTVSAVVDSAALVGAVVLAVNFLLLALFLRALVAPLYLLASSLLSVAATLGLTAIVFQRLLGHGDLTYYVPFAAGVLLVSFGSDYNVFVAGRIWQEARTRPLREAVAVAAPRASRAITVAGLALACSFAMLAVVPLDGFHEFAFMMVAGILLEAFVVRTILIPSLVSLFGRTSAWPGRIRLGGRAAAVFSRGERGSDRPTLPPSRKP